MAAVVKVVPTDIAEISKKANAKTFGTAQVTSEKKLRDG